MELFNYYECIYAGVISPATVPAIDRETLQILKMLLQNSGYDLGKFMVKLENWYDDSMKRVGGWYKRQTQLIIFIIGMILAITFNVDVIQVAGKLSSDKDARDKLVQLAVQAADKYKDDPRVKKIVVKEGTVVQDTTSIGKSYNDSIFKLYQANVDSAKKLIQGDISSANDILAIGWGDYGKLRDGSDVLLRYKVQRSERALDSLYNKYWIRLKVKYILVESGHGKKFLGFLILAFAVSLGSPFWFDLLNKMMKLRSSEQEATGTKVK
jgi:hypothetical protein